MECVQFHPQRNCETVVRDLPTGTVHYHVRYNARFNVSFNARYYARFNARYHASFNARYVTRCDAHFFD